MTTSPSVGGVNHIVVQLEGTNTLAGSAGQ